MSTFTIRHICLTDDETGPGARSDAEKYPSVTVVEPADDVIMATYACGRCGTSLAFTRPSDDSDQVAALLDEKSNASDG